MPRIVVIFSSLVLAAMLAACASDDAQPTSDAGGSDTAVDAGVSDAADADGSDADRPDVASDGGTDASDAGGSDADRPDVAFDGGADASDATEPDTADPDAADPDAADSGDGGSDAADTGDAGSTDAGAPAPGFGTISGDCRVLAGDLFDDASPRVLRNRIDFADDPFDDGDIEALTDGGYEVYTDPNAGGSSILSETFAFEILARCGDAALVATELEVTYDPDTSAKTDFVVAFDGRTIGVSVTRAVTFPRDAPLGVAEAERRMTGKLEDILESTANAVGDVVWDRQILHVIAWGPDHADDVAAAWESLGDAVRADTVLVVTTTDGDDAFIYD